MLEPFAGKLLVKGIGIMVYQTNHTYKKVPHGSNNPNISDYLAFTMLVSLKHYLNVGYWLSMEDII